METHDESTLAIIESHKKAAEEHQEAAIYDKEVAQHHGF